MPSSAAPLKGTEVEQPGGAGEVVAGTVGVEIGQVGRAGSVRPAASWATRRTSVKAAGIQRRSRRTVVAAPASSARVIAPLSVVGSAVTALRSAIAPVVRGV